MTNVTTNPASLEVLRPLLQGRARDSHRKTLGQCFTGMRTGRLLAALAGTATHGRVLDPMAGDGDLLEAAAERSARTKGHSELFGVEIEPSTAQLSKRRLDLCSDEYDITVERIVCGNAFSLTVWQNMAAQVPFDLVITNPPFVRYQTYLNNRGSRNSHLLSPGSDDVRGSLAAIVWEIAAPNERSIWDELVRAYSGLADLSLPSWLLCGVLTKPGGTLALIVPQTWLNRDYARVARYAFLRFFEPLAVVQESGQRWFEELVRVSLVVGRRLPASVSCIPLHERNNRVGSTTFVEIASGASSAKSHVGTAFPGRDPEGQFTRWLRDGCIECRPGINTTQISWASQCEELFSLCRKAKWFRALERTGVDHDIDSTEMSSQSIPPTIRSVLPPNVEVKFQRLEESGICVGQGLRTGCNDFFYVDALPDAGQQRDTLVRTSVLFGGRVFRIPRSTIRPVVRKQMELNGKHFLARSLRGRALNLQGYFLPEDIERRIARNHSGETVPGGYRIMPPALADYVRLAARTYLERNKRRTLIPELSAVRPNGFGPSNMQDGLKGTGTGSLRMWYMLPNFTARHVAPVLLPRIIHDSPRPILNSVPPILVDANFSTLWPITPLFSGDLIFGLLSSTWVELCIEALGTPLGGGALKLEATQIRQIPLPILSDPQKTELTDVVRSWRRRSRQDALALRAQIDGIVISALFSKRLKVGALINIRQRFSEQIMLLRRKRRLLKTCEIADRRI